MNEQWEFDVPFSQNILQRLFFFMFFVSVILFSVTRSYNFSSKILTTVVLKMFQQFKIVHACMHIHALNNQTHGEM